MTRSVDRGQQEGFAAAVSELIRDSRRRQKLTQSQLAARTGGLVSKAALANYETGHRSLRIDVLWVIARALGEDLGHLMSVAERTVSDDSRGNGNVPMVIDTQVLRASTDARLLPVVRWMSLQPDAARAQNGRMVLDADAIDALSTLMGLTPAETWQALAGVRARMISFTGDAPGTATG